MSPDQVRAYCARHHIHVEAPKRQSDQPRPEFHPRGEVTKRILQALADGPLNHLQIGERVGYCVKGRVNSLVREGKLLRVQKGVAGGGRGRPRVLSLYALAPQRSSNRPIRRRA